MQPSMVDFIKIVESFDSHDDQIAAIGQLIADKTDHEDSESRIKTSSFVRILNDMGIPASTQTLMHMVQTGNNAVIKDLNEKYVTFKGQKDINPEIMDVDKAQNLVKKMAKRSAKKSIKK